MHMQRGIHPPKKVIVIGSGVGGLSAAIFLAQLGFAVTVIEKNPLPGGLMRSYTRGGVDCSVGVHYLGALGEGQVLRRLFDFLGVTSAVPVKRMGADGVIDRYIFEDFTFDLPEGFDAYEENLKATFGSQKGRISAIMDRLRFNGRKIASLDFLFSTKNDASMLEEIKPVGEIVTRLGCSPDLKKVLGVPCHWVGVPMDSCPMFYHNMALATYLFSSWRLACSGTDMVNAFVRRLEDLGGKIRCGDAVDRILSRDRMVEGVQLASGKRLESTMVVGAVHPQVILDLLSPEEIKPAYKNIVHRLKNTEGFFCAHFSIEAASTKAIPHNIFKISTQKDGHIRDLKYYQITKTKRSGTNLLTILTAGEPHLWNRWAQTTSGSRGSGYSLQKEKRAWDLIPETEAVLGPLSGTTLLDAYTPLTIRDWVNSPGGSAYGVRRSCDQLLETSVLSRAAVRGLFFAGQSVMAPGILGTIIGSVHTIKQMIGNAQFFNAFRDLNPGADTKF